MNKKIYIPVLAFVIIIILSSSFHRVNENASINYAVENEDTSSAITVLSPMTLSNNDMYPLYGENQYLRLQMVKGKYYEDWSPSPYMGTIWEGYFVIELVDDLGNSISQIDLSTVYNEALIFTSAFEIEFDDYNNDGDFDFTIGQYASSNGRSYKLFTIRKDGKIDVLPIKDNSSLFISNTTGYYSTKLTKKTDTSFVIKYYDNSLAMDIENVFEWNGTEFYRK
ncbi:MAG: hypothetical protein K0R15_1060 [Clostridiales bacterium]|nr:hypothetical protein [Clostridiales bacterium]